MDLFISGFLLSLSLCFDLGIVNVAIIKAGIEKGFLSSFFIGMGSTSGDLVYVILSISGISLLLDHFWIRWILWITGTAVLLFFCASHIIQLIKLKDNSGNDNNSPELNNSGKTYLFQGFLLALSSPTSILWFATVGGSVIATQSLHRYYELAWFFMGFSFASVIWSIALAWICSKGAQHMKYPIKKMISLISIIVFFILTGYVFWKGYTAFIK